MRTIYLDNNATTKPDPAVIEAMLPFYTEMWGNPLSMYRFGNQIERHIEKAREQVAKLVGARRVSEIVFNSGGTEGNNTALHSALAASPEKKHIVTTAVEHSATITPCQELEKQGYQVTYLGVDEQGQLNLTELEAALTDNTALATIIWANNETGVVFPIKEIAKICEQKNVPLHVDGIQGVGKLPIELRNLPISYFTISSHKIHGPKGMGALYIKRGTKFTPLLSGGGHEMSRRAGTINVAGIIGLGKACELAREHLPLVNAELRDRLEQGLLSQIDGAAINGDKQNRLSNTLSISFEHIDSASLLLMLSEEFGICASAGSACQTGSVKPSHVIQAMRLPRWRQLGVVRLSTSRYTSKEEVDDSIELITKTVMRMRGKT